MPIHDSLGRLSLGTTASGPEWGGVEKLITVRFWKIVRLGDSSRPFESVLESAFEAAASAPAREREVVAGKIVRLERISNDGAFVDGEFARIQRDGLPHATGPEGLVPLDHDALGHAVAFRFHKPLSVLAMQADRNSVSPTRALQYLRLIDPSAAYSAEPLENADAWERFDRGEPKRFSITMAAAGNAQAVDPVTGSIASGARQIGEALAGTTVRIEVSSGRARGSLSKDALRSIITYFGGDEAGSSGVTSLSVTSKQADERSDDIINFLDDLLKMTREVNLPLRDIDGHYQERRRIVTACFAETFDYIQQYYGTAA